VFRVFRGYLQVNHGEHRTHGKTPNKKTSAARRLGADFDF
jgi:hypothetical protein